MESDLENKRRKRPLGQRDVLRGPRSYEQRMLKSYPLRPPTFQIEMNVLQNEYVEYEVTFAGIIPGIPEDVDVTNRTDVLRIIDSGKKLGNIPLRLGFEDAAVLSLCKSNIKITRRHSEEVPILLRVPTHEIAAICYIKDDNIHILSIKFGNPDKCDLAVLYCDTKLLAEGICALLEKCFQMVYTEATLQLLDKVLDSKSFDGKSSDSPTITPHPIQYPENFSSKTPSEISEMSTQAKLLQEYMMQLPSQFNLEELQKFATLLRDLNNTSSQMPFRDFCDQIYALYGAERKQLLVGLCPFIPEKDYKYFSGFLKKHGIDEPENGTLSSRNSYSGRYRRSISDYSGTGSEEVESILDQISSQFERIEASVGTVNTYLQT